ISAQCDIAIAGSVVKERECSNGIVFSSDIIANECVSSNRHVRSAGGVEQKRCCPHCRVGVSVVERQRSTANTGIEGAGDIRKQRTPTKCCISSASIVANKRIITEKRVEAAGVAAPLANRLRVRRKRKTGEHE